MFRSVVREALLTLTLLLILDACLADHWGDSCDITVWGNSGEGVRSVIATCSQGRLDWRPALGGLRVSFATSGGLAARWRLCLRGVVRSALVVLSVEEDEGLRRLAVMGGSRRGGGSSGRTVLLREYCIESSPHPKRSPLPTLYLDAAAQWRPQVAGQPSVRLDYDLESLPALADPNYDSHFEECRPCSEDELLTAVCSRDFVVTGTIDDVVHNTLRAEAAILVRADNVIRQSRHFFSSPPSGNGTRGGRATPARALVGRIVVPLRCGVQKGAGRFLFVGRLRLERLRLSCAPRLEEFDRLWRRAVAEGRNLCRLG